MKQDNCINKPIKKVMCQKTAGLGDNQPWAKQPLTLLTATKFLQWFLESHIFLSQGSVYVSEQFHLLLWLEHLQVKFWCQIWCSLQKMSVQPFARWSGLSSEPDKFYCLVKPRGLGQGHWGAWFKPLRVIGNLSGLSLRDINPDDPQAPAVWYFLVISDASFYVHTWPVSFTLGIFLVSSMMWPSPVTMRSSREQLSSAQPSVMWEKHHWEKPR